VEAVAGEASPRAGQDVLAALLAGLVAQSGHGVHVLIIGAGPNGMTLATSLKQLGLDCVVVDQLAEAPDDTRAAFVQPRTLEYLHRIQVAGPMIDDGLKGRGAAFADVDRDLIRVPYDTVDSPYPFLLMIPQSQTQRHLDRRFEELGGSVLRGVRLLDLVPEFPGSAVTLMDSAGSLRVINARFVAGCDGVFSRVRNQLGIGFLAAHRRRCLRSLT
jgi:2-polyprenyl-6-methoxyphenol hydroxylase-like FAD-dependent oxidoreductase